MLQCPLSRTINGDGSSCHHHSKAPGTLHLSKSSPLLSGSSPFSLVSSVTTLNPAHSFHTFSSCAYRSITQGSQLLPQQSPAGGLTGFVGDVAAARRALSRTGAGRAFNSFVRVGEWDFSVAVEMVGCDGGGTVISTTGRSSGTWSHQTTDLADVNTESIRNIKQSLLQESRGTVSDHTIALHLSETETTVTCSTFDRLTSQDLGRTTGTSVNLVTASYQCGRCT
ncbi:hypothetical protein KCU81_g743, partial [Aureobasidium melanogenum]